MTIFIQNTPAIRVLVDKAFLGSSGTEEAYLTAVTSIPGRPLFFSVHLESGALWQRLPITALKCSRFNDIQLDGPKYTLDELQPYSCLEGSINVITYNHLKNYEVQCKIGNNTVKGYYLFTVDVIGEGLSEDPIQHKSHNICVLECGQLCALPNNFVVFKDNYFTNTETPCYHRVDEYYLAGG